MSRLNSSMTADQLRESWQGRAIRFTLKRPIRYVLYSIIAFHDDEAADTLFRAAIPDYRGLYLPQLCSEGRISKTGSIVADMINKEGLKVFSAIMFLNEEHMQTSFRHLADDMKLNDDDRRDLFKCAQSWIRADFRLDPTMNINDPDARRYAVH